MSIYGALFSGVSGLNAQSVALGAISDNITNVNTVGYKANDTLFSTLVIEGTSTASYQPGGVQAKTRQLVTTPGLLQSSASNTDLAIDGQGFFVTRPSPTSTEVRFTRAGSFTQDAAGNLVNSAGNYLLGWPLDASGNFTNNGSTNGLVPVSTSGLTGTAEATSSVRLRANLQASQTVNSNIAAYNATDPLHSVAAGTFPADFVQSIPVYDGQGGIHNINLAFVKSATPNVWNAELYLPNNDGTATPPSAVSNLIASGTVVFNGDGSIKLQADPLIPGDTNFTSLLSSGGVALAAPLNVTWNNGAATRPIKFALGSNGAFDGLTQYDAQSQRISTNADGAVFGNVIGVNVGKDGTVSAQFSNGVTRDVYRLPIATFQNPDDLQRLQGNAYAASTLSGAFVLNSPGVGGAGRISSSTLEASTVDLGNEFTKLITTQRAYSAAAKVITTADEILTELNQIKR